MNRRSLPVAVGLAVIGGLLLVGAASTNWVVVEEARQIGGVPLVERQGTPGVELAPQGVAMGVLAAMGGLALVVVRGRGRRLLGLAVGATGIVAAMVVGSGVVRAADEPGHLTAAPWVAAAGAVAAVASGVVAWRRPAPAPVLGEQYSIDEEPDGDEEWGVASDDL